MVKSKSDKANDSNLKSIKSHQYLEVLTNSFLKYSMRVMYGILSNFKLYNKRK